MIFYRRPRPKSHCFLLDILKRVGEKYAQEQRQLDFVKDLLTLKSKDLFMTLPIERGNTETQREDKEVVEGFVAFSGRCRMIFLSVQEKLL